MGSSKGATAAPPPVAPQSSGMDPTMMQMMMQMMMQNSQMQATPQMPEAPQQIEAPQPVATEPVNWQEQMQEFRDRAASTEDSKDSQRLVNAFMPAMDEDDEASLLTETTDA